MIIHKFCYTLEINGKTERGESFAQRRDGKLLWTHHKPTAEEEEARENGRHKKDEEGSNALSLRWSIDEAHDAHLSTRKFALCIFWGDPGSYTWKL